VVEVAVSVSGGAWEVKEERVVFVLMGAGLMLLRGAVKRRVKVQVLRSEVRRVFNFGERETEIAKHLSSLANAILLKR
jgi:hypothetical protein